MPVHTPRERHIRASVSSLVYMTTPTKPTLAGDDVGAIVADCGSWLVRVGAAGDDAPKALVPPAVAVPSEGSRFAGDRVLLAPTGAPDIAPVFSHEVSGTATVSDWDAMQLVWQAGAKQAGADLKAAPFMIVEPTRAWDDDSRSKALERAFEGCEVGCAYLGRGAAMSAFASARTTACVVDVGHQGASAVPVVDGYTLRKTTISSEVGGHFLSEQLHVHAENQMAKSAGAEVNDTRAPIGSSLSRMRALHEVRRRRKPDAPAPEGAVETEAVRQFSFEDLSVLDPQKSFTDHHRAFYRLRLLDDFKVSTFRVSPGASTLSNPAAASTTNGDVVMGEAGDETAGKGTAEHGQGSNAGGNGVSTTNPESGADAIAAGIKSDKEAKELDREKEREREIEKSREKERFPSLSTTYELPDGNVIDVSKQDTSDSYIADALFENGQSGSESRRAISKMAFDAISACDIDMRREMFGGIILTGGCSLIPGTVERFTRELAILTPQLFKMKIIASQTSIERTAGPWIGGSIVSSLGTFQQAWISKAEYDELGANGALRKCP